MAEPTITNSPKPNGALPVSAFDLFKRSTELVRANLNLFAWLYLYPLIITIIQVANDFREENGREPWYDITLSNPSVALIGLGSVVTLLALAVYAVVIIMLFGAELRIAKGQKTEIADLWPMVKEFWPRMVSLFLVVGLVIIFGLILLIVPGLIFFRRYLLSPYVMLDKNLSITDSMRESSRLSKPYSGSVWGLIGVSILLALTGIIPYIGWAISFVLAALYSVAPALRYLELKKLLKA